MWKTNRFVNSKYTFNNSFSSLSSSSRSIWIAFSKCHNRCKIRTSKRIKWCTNKFLKLNKFGHKHNSNLNSMPNPSLVVSNQHPTSLTFSKLSSSLIPNINSQSNSKSNPSPNFTSRVHSNLKDTLWVEVPKKVVGGLVVEAAKCSCITFHSTVNPLYLRKTNKVQGCLYRSKSWAKPVLMLKMAPTRIKKGRLVTEGQLGKFSDLTLISNHKIVTWPLIFQEVAATSISWTKRISLPKTL